MQMNVSDLLIFFSLCIGPGSVRRAFSLGSWQPSQRIP